MATRPTTRVQQLRIPTTVLLMRNIGGTGFRIQCGISQGNFRERDRYGQRRTRSVTYIYGCVVLYCNCFFYGKRTCNGVNSIEWDFEWSGSEMPLLYSFITGLTV